MRSLFAAAALLALACGGGSANQVIMNTQQNSMPTGTIEGRVLDAATGAPIAGAQLQTFSDKAVMAVTDPNGHYTLGPLPGGSSYTVYVTQAGYVKRIFSANLDASAGNYPVGNGVTTVDIDLAKGDATVDGLVITSTGQAAGAASLFADLRSSGFDLVINTKTDMNGKFQIMGLPGTAAGLTVTVSVAPFDVNMDGMPDFTAQTQGFRMYPGFTTTGTITLSAIGVVLVSSNISDGDLAPGDPITLAFATPIATGQSTVLLRSLSQGETLGVATTWDSTNTQLTVTPVGGMLATGQTYQLQYTVRALSGGQTNGTLTFTVRPANAMPPSMPVQNLKVVSPMMMKYDYSTSSVSLSWDMLTDAGGYHVYGKDTATSPVYVLLSSISNPATTTANINSLSSYFGTSGYALSFGNKVTLAVVATDKAGNEAPLTMASTVDLSDNTLPTVTFPSQAVSANNTASATAKMVTYSVQFSEPMQTSTTPQLSLMNASVTFTFAWQGTQTGVFTLTVPAMTDGSGQTQITGARDTSGNAMMMYNGSLF
jgi:hypothetical protein